MDIPVHVVLENQCRGEVGAQEPAQCVLVAQPGERGAPADGAAAFGADAFEVCFGPLGLHGDGDGKACYLGGEDELLLAGGARTGDGCDGAELWGLLVEVQWIGRKKAYAEGGVCFWQGGDVEHPACGREAQVLRDTGHIAGDQIVEDANEEGEEDEGSEEANAAAGWCDHGGGVGGTRARWGVSGLEMAKEMREMTPRAVVSRRCRRLTVL